MESIKETMASFKEAFIERLRNPFLAAFIISWVFCNWRPLVYIMFSEARMEDRIAHINDAYSGLWQSVFLPLTIATIYTFGMPYVLWFVEWCVQKALEGRIGIDGDKKIARLKKQQDIAREEVNLELERAQHKDRHAMNSQMDRLKEQLTTLETSDQTKSLQIQNMQKTITGLNDQLAVKGNALETAEQNLAYQRRFAKDHFDSSAEGVFKIMVDIDISEYGFKFVGLPLNRVYVRNVRTHKRINQVLMWIKAIKDLSQYDDNYKLEKGEDGWSFSIHDNKSIPLAQSPTFKTKTDCQGALQEFKELCADAIVLGLDGQPAWINASTHAMSKALDSFGPSSPTPPPSVIADNRG